MDHGSLWKLQRELAEKFLTLPSDAEQSTKQQCQDETPCEQSQLGLSDSSSSCAGDTTMHVHKNRNLHVMCHPPREKTAFQTSQASGRERVDDHRLYNENELSSWTEDPKAKLSCSTWTTSAWWRWLTGCHHHKSFRHAKYKYSSLTVLQMRMGAAIFAIQGIQWHVEIVSVLYISHQCRSEPVYVEPVFQAQVGSCQVWLGKKSFQSLKN